MDPSTLAKAAILGIVEGATEFLPVSSTGHLVLASRALAFPVRTVGTFEVVVQSGAAAAILWEYRRTYFRNLTALLNPGSQARRFLGLLLIATAPAAMLGLAFGSAITTHLFKPVPVAAALVVGGVAILLIEPRAAGRTDVEEVGWRQALGIGLAQCLALFPGVSRAAATILGGLMAGLSRRAATEFSFQLAVPLLLGASVYQLVMKPSVARDDVTLLLVGSFTAFVAALVCVRWLVVFVSNHTFQVFAWYRIVVGLLILAWVAVEGRW